MEGFLVIDRGMESKNIISSQRNPDASFELPRGIFIVQFPIPVQSRGAFGCDSLFAFATIGQHPESRFKIGGFITIAELHRFCKDPPAGCKTTNGPQD